MTFTILQLDCSVSAERSVSRKLTDILVNKLKSTHSDHRVIYRDLNESPVPHLNSKTIEAFFTPVDQHDDSLESAIKLSDELISDLMHSDAIVIGAPMYNFGIPSTLKAWIDHVVRAGKTFRYGDAGMPEGLVPTGKNVFIASARGGIYSEEPMQAMDFQENYLKVVLNFIGLTDVAFFRAEGVAVGPEARSKALESAVAQIEQAA